MPMPWRAASVGIMTMLLLSGCAVFHRESPKSVISADCQILKQQEKYRNNLQNQGIEVVEQGEEVTLYLPVSLFFYTNSNHLQSSAMTRLNNVIRFVNTYQTVDIAVTGYTDNNGNSLRNLALSRAQAAAVANYLWANGLNARLLTSFGEGCKNFVASNNSFRGREANRRIVIFFRLPPPDNVFL